MNHRLLTTALVVCSWISVECATESGDSPGTCQGTCTTEVRESVQSSALLQKSSPSAPALNGKTVGSVEGPVPKVRSHATIGNWLTKLLQTKPQQQGSSVPPEHRRRRYSSSSSSFDASLAASESSLAGASESLGSSSSLLNGSIGSFFRSSSEGGSLYELSAENEASSSAPRDTQGSLNPQSAIYMLNNKGPAVDECLFSYGQDSIVRFEGREMGKPNCGFRTQDDLVNNKLALWKIEHLSGSLYTIKSTFDDKCLISKDGKVERHKWGQIDSNLNCGFSTQDALIDNKQGVWKIEHLSGLLYTIKSTSEDKCLASEKTFIFMKMKVIPTVKFRTWGDSNSNCGFLTQDALMENGWGVWELTAVPDSR